MLAFFPLQLFCLLRTEYCFQHIKVRNASPLTSPGVNPLTTLSDIVGPLRVVLGQMTVTVIFTVTAAVLHYFFIRSSDEVDKAMLEPKPKLKHWRSSRGRRKINNREAMVSRAFGLDVLAD